MKLLFVSSASVRTRNAYNHRLYKLAEGLRRLGAKADFLYLRDRPFSRPQLAQPLNLPFVWRGLQGYDFIHAGDDAAYTAVLWKRFTTAPIIYDVHGDTWSEAWLDWQTDRRLRQFFYIFQALVTTRVGSRLGDYFLVVSGPLKELLLTRGVPERRIFFVRNGVDTELFRPPGDGPTTNEHFTVCYAGRFQSWQGTDALVEAARKLHDEDIKFRLIGFDTTDEPLKRRIAGELGEKVELLNRLPQAELAAHLMRADVLIIPRQPHPATVVAFPTKFAEYAALGQPVIVSDVDETARMVRERGCGLVAVPTAEGFAEAILAAKRLSPQERRRMGQNGRQLAEELFSWEVICRDYYNRLQEALGDG
jgi:glycosyltransferase involved in cell wall biosynthesis